MTGFIPQGVVHVHPTLRCNLACAHCYSTSSAQHTDQLASETFLPHLEALADDGYEVLSVSGGEPLLYRELAPLATGARALGFRVHVISNGFAVSARQVETLAPLLDLVAISIDGDEETHDTLRRAPGSFDRAVDSLRRFRDRGVRVAVVSCVTRTSLPLVPALHDLCAREHVSLLSLRPIVDVGRAQETASESTYLTPHDLLRLEVMARLLDDAAGTRVRADVAFAGDIRREAALAYPFLADVGSGTLAENVNPLVIREDGGVIPYVYGMADAFALGNVQDSPAALAEARLGWLPRIRSLVQGAMDALSERDQACVDWFEEILHHSRTREAATGDTGTSGRVVPRAAPIAAER